MSGALVKGVLAGGGGSRNKMPGGRRILHFTVLFSAIFPKPLTASRRALAPRGSGVLKEEVS